MNLGTTSRYALYAMLDLVRSDDAALVSVASIARRHHIPETALAKVFQRLVHSGVVVGLRGARGGYRLARPAAEITVLDVVNVFEPRTPTEDAGVTAAEGEDDSLSDFFDAVNGQVLSAFGSVTLERLAASRGRSRPPL
ncbi:MAG TPA: Rrf2 family transcriptional regulator [Candidatus Krumholzibacteria bacterium]|nr:Rrf2 family transcriptional regulator [Candidatus Krumholzibacteria bacterium]